MELPKVPLAEINLSNPEFWAKDHAYRHGAFKTLRDESPYQFFEEWEFENSPIPRGPGYFALTRYEDIWHVSRHPEIFCSGKGTNIGDLTVELNEFFGSMINMDDPKHFRLRSIVSKGFTPKEINRVENYVLAKAKEVVDTVIEKYPNRQCDFVSEIAAPFPLEIICEMMGIPKDDYAQILTWTNTILGVGDPELVTSIDDLLNAGLNMFAYAQALGEDRVKNPTDDLTSVMMNAEVDGERLSAQEFGSFFILLVVAGNETTRNAISHGLKALTDNPDQRQLWWDNFDAHTKTAVEEIVRYSSPVVHFRRTATQDTEINGFPVKEGQKVVMWYLSGNRDERTYADPFRFDIRREPLPAQIGFGAGGPHFCLGANLARREIAVMFDEIRRRLPNLRVEGEPAFLQSNFINGVKRMPCSW
jgi:cytochrome P450